MKLSVFSRYALNSCISAAMLAGCGGSQPPIGAQGAMPERVQNHEAPKLRTAMPSYKVSGPLIYVASYDLDLTPVRVYKANEKDPKPIAAISKDVFNARGVCIDGEGTLYVTNAGSSNKGYVLEYALGQTKPLRVITKGIDYPGYCAIDASGNLWVANIGGVNVTEYLKNSTKPHATITKGLTEPDGIAIDHKGNLYVSNFEPQSSPNIQVYAPGSKSPSRTITDGISVPTGIAVDAHGTLYVTNDTAPGNIEEYRSGQSKPYRVITGEFSYPGDVVVGKNGWLYVAGVSESDKYWEILEFPPHSLKPSSKRITKGVFDALGVAYYPPLLP
ncbi:MAG TPA: hypothetical protein VKR56_10345 [Candidatus Cybelea sp.]|nr:hypothetical protein [Candidatus Cybelea sp.]